jgi:hypothetical protein
VVPARLRHQGVGAGNGVNQQGLNVAEDSHDAVLKLLIGEGQPDRGAKTLGTRTHHDSNDAIASPASLGPVVTG